MMIFSKANKANTTSILKPFQFGKKMLNTTLLSTKTALTFTLMLSMLFVFCKRQFMKLRIGNYPDAPYFLLEQGDKIIESGICVGVAFCVTQKKIIAYARDKHFEADIEGAYGSKIKRLLKDNSTMLTKLMFIKGEVTGIKTLKLVVELTDGRAASQEFKFPVPHEKEEAR